MKRIDMINVKTILRLRHDLKLSRDDIVAASGVSGGTVSNVLERAAAAGLACWPLPDDLDDGALRERLYPQVERDGGHVPPDWDDLVKEYKKPRQRRRTKEPHERRRTKVTRRQLWVEYRDDVLAQGGTAYSYSRFCSLFTEQLKERASPQMHFDYEPGLYGMSDFSGKTLALRTATGDVDVEIFVAVLAHSNLIYTEAVPNQKVCHWTMAHRRALEYYGGSVERWIIDNLKSGVVKADREAPHLNPSFREFAKHYGLAVLPARKNEPTDKGLVEGAVRAVQSRILLALRHETFFSLEAMNAAIRRELDRLNQAPMSCGTSRRALFEQSERAALKPLPEHAWEWGEWFPRKVGQNGHVAVHRNYYSVPEAYMGHHVEARVGERMVEVFLEQDGERIAVHRRSGGRNQYMTRPEHMPDHLNAVRDIRKPDYGTILLRRARRVGENARAWAERCFASRDFPEQAFTTVQGMIRLAETHGSARVDALCSEALDLGRLASGYLRERLKDGGKAAPLRSEPDEIIPRHANIRGGAYYCKTNKGETQ